MASVAVDNVLRARAPTGEAGADPHNRTAIKDGGDVLDDGVLLRAASAIARANPDGSRDVILVPISGSYAHLGLNMLLNLRRLGYAHVLLLAADAPTCVSALALAPMPARCVWDGRWERDAALVERAAPWASVCGPAECRSSERACDCAHEPLASYRMWLSRWWVNARLVAAGFDTLMLDLDVALLDDVYAYFRQPPLDRYALLFHSESLSDPFGNVQCGLVYARASRKRADDGAHDGVRGGVAKAVAGFPLRILRFLDTAWDRSNARGRSAAGSGEPAGPPLWAESLRRAAHFLFDQVHLVDVVQSQVAGVGTFRMFRGYDSDTRRPRVREVGTAHARNGTGSVAVVTDWSARDAPGRVLNSHIVNELYAAFTESRGGSRTWTRRQLGGARGAAALPYGWRARFGLGDGDQHAAIFEARLTDGWPADVNDLPFEGGVSPLAPISDGSLAARFLRELEQDARSAPRSQAPAAAVAELAEPTERVALLPTWLVSHWREGIKGGWGIDPPAAIAAHATNAVDKLLVLTAHGLFDRAAYAAAPGTVHHALFVSGAHVPVVAYEPSLSMAPAAGARAPLEFEHADDWRGATLHGLPASALVSRRAIAYPHVPCGSAWLNRQHAEAANWTQGSCRTGLCSEWRVTAVGYVDGAEAAARAALRSALPSMAGARAVPLPPDQRITCDVHPNMAWPDGPVRKLFGYKCNMHAPYYNASPMVGYALSAWDVHAYAARLGAAGAPDQARNVAFAREAAERRAGRAPRGLLRVSEDELRAELARFAAEPIVWLGWPLNVTEPREGEGRLAWRMRRFCERWFVPRVTPRREAKMPNLSPLMS